MLRSLLLSLSSNKSFRDFAESAPLGQRISRRFVAGVTIEEALAAAAELNREGMDVSLDSLGENVLQVAQAEEAAEVYHRLLDEIASQGLRANVSVKLTQMGMEIGGHGAGPELAERIMGELVEHASRTGNFVRVDMEGSDYTEATLAVTERLNARFPGHVGTVLQAYLYRTEDDLERLLAQGIRIRLCKGAYKEPPDRAFSNKADVDANFVRLMKRAATSGVLCGVATHDEDIINEMRRFVEQGGASKEAFEFQMLYGIRRDLQRELVGQGFGMRVYVPFGKEWFPYFMRRLAERPANALFVAKNLFKE